MVDGNGGNPGAAGNMESKSYGLLVAVPIATPTTACTQNWPSTTSFVGQYRAIRRGNDVKIAICGNG